MLSVNSQSIPPTSKDVLYTRVSKTIIRRDGSEQERLLRLTVECDSGLSPVCQKTLHIMLSDDEDPYIVYGISISEEDFKSIKEQQNLLVDFTNFFEHLVRLFDKCIDSDNSRFVLMVASEGEKPVFGQGTQLQVLEVTNFKRLCHLSLSVHGGSDTDVKKHMAQKIRTLQDKNKKIEEELKNVQLQLEDITMKLEAKTDSCSQIIAKFMEEKTVLHSDLTQELMNQKEKYSKAMLEAQKTLELEKQCVEDKYQDIVKNLEAQIASLKSQLQTVMEKNSQAEFANREMKKELDDAGTEVENVRKELSLARRQNADLDSDYHEKERVVQSLRTRLAVNEQELKDRAEMLRKEQDENQLLVQQKQRLEEALMEKEGSIQRLQACLQTVSEDFVKANEILTMHQTELASVRTKLQLSTNVAFEQEKILEAKSKKFSEVMELLDASNKKARELENEESKLKETLEEFKKISIEKDKRLQLNEAVIDRLNRRLNEHQTPAPAPPPARWPLRYSQQRTIIGTSLPIHHSVAPRYYHSAYGSTALPESRVGAQMPIKTTDHPQLQIFKRGKNVSEAVAMSNVSFAEAANGHHDKVDSAKPIGDSGDSGSGGRVPDDIRNEKETEPKGIAPSVDPPEDSKSSGCVSKTNSVGGILRIPNRPPISAYFNSGS